MHGCRAECRRSRARLIHTSEFSFNSVPMPRTSANPMGKLLQRVALPKTTQWGLALIDKVVQMKKLCCAESLIRRCAGITARGSRQSTLA